MRVPVRRRRRRRRGWDVDFITSSAYSASKQRMAIAVAGMEQNMAWLNCMVSPGQFSSEYAIQGQEADGTGFSAFIPSSCVECEKVPRRGELLPGFVQVEIMEERENLRLVRLPRPTL